MKWISINLKNVFLVPIIIFVFSAAEQQSCIKNDELRLINHWYSCRQLIDLIPHDIINIKQIDNQSNILRRWCGMHEPIIWRTSYVDEGSIKDKESSILCENQIANKLFFFCYELVLDSIDKSVILLISCLATLRSPSTHENLIKFLHMIIISYPGTTLSNAHELTLSSLLQINVWRASVDGAPILKLGDSSVYLVFFSLQR